MDKQDRFGARGIYFTDVFQIDPQVLADYGAFNVCPWIDMPLFIDPFLLFASEKQEYQQLHDQIIGYLLYLRNHAIESKFLSEGNLRYLYCFKEVFQNCLGFTVDGIRGAGLGPTFGRALHKNLNKLLDNFGEESITDGSHFEKLSLIEPGVGRDKISDLTTNLIKGFLLQYTETFAIQNIDPKFRKKFSVNKAQFDETTGLWHARQYDLPSLGEDFILLTPEDILTKDDTWINKEEFKKDFLHIRDSISDIELRDRVTEYFEARLPKRFEKNRFGQLEEKPPTQSDKNDAIQKTLREFPEIIDHYIKQKEEKGEEALKRAAEKVASVKGQLVDSVRLLVSLLEETGDFFKCGTNSISEAQKKIEWFKHVIEDKDGYRAFYHNGEPVRLEKNFQAMFKLVWEGSSFSCDAEVNNGRGPVDFKVSKGDADQTLIEFKLANNTNLRSNLENQVEIYKKANNATQAFKVIIYFTEGELSRIKSILPDLDEAQRAGIILIDARSDNKPSASKAR